MTSRDYVTNAIQNLEDMLARDGAQTLKIYGKKAGETPFPSNCRPKLYISPVSDDTLTSQYLQLIGVLRWAIELDRIHVMAEVSVLSPHQCQPREGHLEAVYCVFRYIKGNLRDILGRIFFDSKTPVIEEQLFHTSDKSVWEEFYPDAEEEIPGNDLPIRGKPIYVGCYVEAEHAGNMLIRRSHICIIIFVSNSPIIWYSK